MTFDRLADQNKDAKGKNKIKIWGSEERFKDFKKSKIKNIPITPGPGMYPLVAEWPGKDSKKKDGTKTKNWMEGLTKGVNRSIYYE